MLSINWFVYSNTENNRSNDLLWCLASSLYNLYEDERFAKNWQIFLSVWRNTRKLGATELVFLFFHDKFFN